MARSLPGAVAALVVAALMATFIAYPIGAMLTESFVVSGPMSLERLKTVTEAALARLPDEVRRTSLERWVSRATEKERVTALAAAFELADLPIGWNRSGAFSEQSTAIAEALEALSADDRAAVEAAYPVALVMLHRRVALAFQVRDRLDAGEFDALRTGAEARWGVDHYLRVFTERHLRAAAANSLWLALCTSLSVTALALLLSYGLNRGGIPRPRLMRGLLLLPLVAPPVLVATATIMLFGRRGLVTHTLLDRTLGWIDADMSNLYGFGGVVLAQTISFLPAALIVLDDVLRKHDGRIEEAAVSLGADRWGTFRLVTVPIAWPGIKRVLVLVSIMSLTDFGNPELLGQGWPVVAGVIYDEITAFRNMPLAAALCVWLIAPSLIAYLLLETIGRRKRYTSTAAGAPPEIGLPLAWRGALSALAFGVAGVIVLLYATIVLGAFTRLWGVDWSLTVGYFLPEGVDTGHSGTGYGSSDRGLGLVWQSIEMAAIAAPLGGLLGMAIAFVVERVRPPGGNALAFLAMLPAILPGIIFGVGYIVAFNAPLGMPGLALTGTSAILVLNIMFSNLFVGVLAARAALQRVDASVDEAAESLGAGLLQRFVLVTLPMVRSAFLLGTLYVFVDGLTTLSSVIFLVSGEHKLASVAIFNDAMSSDFGYAAAKSVAILLAAAAAMALVVRLEERTRRVAAASGKRPAERAIDFAIAGQAAR